MTWGQLTANRIMVTRFFCGMAERFAVADLYQNAIDMSGHRFIRTAFKVRDAEGKRAISYCPCWVTRFQRFGLAALVRKKRSVRGKQGGYSSLIR
jgi:hypothetical protein